MEYWNDGKIEKLRNWNRKSFFEKMAKELLIPFLTRNDPVKDSWRILNHPVCWKSIFNNHIIVRFLDCSNVNDSFQDTVRSVTCKPRYTYIVLNLKSSQTITPSSVSVPRCYGPPEEGVICAPTANGTRITQRVVSVNTLGGDSSKRQCLRVDVEEHITCEYVYTLLLNPLFQMITVSCASVILIGSAVCLKPCSWI